MPSCGSAAVVVAVAAFFVIQTMYMITVKLLFDRTTAGLYARLELLGKLSFTLASSIALVLLPRAGRAFETAGAENWQFVLVDNGSVDGTPEVVARILQRWQASIDVQLPRPNYGKALKAGLDRATHDAEERRR